VGGGRAARNQRRFLQIRAQPRPREGLILRHLLRLVILAGEFYQKSAQDPDYQRIGELATRVCQQVDPRYTDRFLAAEEEARKLTPI
jgi:hypothetical protein